MSVIPFPSNPEPEDSRTPQAPALRLIPAHEHVWTLRGVDYDDTFEVRRFECESCDDVLFR